MSMSPCDVSVLIPVYNAQSFVAQAIDSVLCQTASNLEVIVVDDASSDGSSDIIASYDDPRIRRFRNVTNLGLVGNWNECLRHARGRYITMLHQDDVMESQNLERKVKTLESSGLSWAASDCVQIDAAGKTLHEHWFQHARALRASPRSRRSQFATMFFERNYLCFPTILWKREVTDTLGGFAAKGGYCVDVYMWLKFLSRYRFVYIDERLVRYRWAQNESLKYNDTDWILDDFLARQDVATDLGLGRYYSMRLKAQYGPRFVSRYISCRLRGDSRGAGTMRRGLAALSS
jgi:glycosyltransferase involved in cell wall biosynthesis